MIPEPAPPFEVTTLGSATADMSQILTAAARHGRGAEIEECLLRMEDALRNRPRDWGDPLRRYAGLKMIQDRGRALPVLAYYSVHERIPFVVLHSVAISPDDPLAEPPSN